MSVDTKAIIRKGVTLQNLVECLSTKFSDIEVLNTSMENFFRIHFSAQGAEKRVVWVSYILSPEYSEELEGIYINSSFRYEDGSGTEAVKLICETFGGYFDENDCDNEGYVPINLHLFEQSNELSALEKFKHKAIAKLGFSKLPDVLELFDEYIAINLSSEEQKLEHFRALWQKTVGGQ